MKIKRFLARNMPEALNMVREDLGQDAVIILSRKVRGKGILGFLAPPLIEVTAALDENDKDAPENSPVNQKDARVITPINAGGMPSIIPVPEETASDNAPAVSPVPQGDPRPENDPLRRELADVKRMLGRLLERQSPPAPEESLQRQWQRLLNEADVGPAVTEQVLDRFRGNGAAPAKSLEESRDVVLDGLREVLAPAYTDDRLKTVLVFVGPTGVGKTTTLAKLAAHLALIEQRRVAMVTIDTYRLGAVEQLRTYAEIMDLPLDVALTPDDLAQALARHAEADYILIDTAGRPSKNTEQVKELLGFLKVIDRPFDVLLVLSSNTKMRDLSRIAGDFQALDYSKLIFTKVDETETLGCIVNVVHEVGRPVVYITNGQNVPYDMHAVHPEKAARMILERVGNNG